MNQMEELTIFCKNVKFLREQHRLSKADMAHKLHISIRALTMIEQGIVPERLGSNVMFYIYRYFNVRPSVLTGRILRAESEEEC